MSYIGLLSERRTAESESVHTLSAPVDTVKQFFKAVETVTLPPRVNVLFAPHPHQYLYVFKFIYLFCILALLVDVW